MTLEAVKRIVDRPTNVSISGSEVTASINDAACLEFLTDIGLVSIFPERSVGH
jgi:hypothetical protein